MGQQYMYYIIITTNIIIVKLLLLSFFFELTTLSDLYGDLDLKLFIHTDKKYQNDRSTLYQCVIACNLFEPTFKKKNYTI